MKFLPFLFLLGCLALTLTAAEPASPEATANDFFHYLLTPKRDIAKDSATQARWLSKDVRHALAAAEAGSEKAAEGHPNEQVDAPDNGTFLGAWDPPTSFKITDTKSTPPTARVNLRYTWGPKSQYPGETRNMTALLTLEDGAWKIRDIRSHAAKFNPESTLLRDLQNLAKQR
ncbi:MAG TPA: hypothetical protein VGM54_11115 [Chthoniobacter sp.]